LFGGSPNGRSLGRRSHDQNPVGVSPLNPHVGLYGWLALDPRIFMPPWYPLIAI
jgi:hypothetical protein